MPPQHMRLQLLRPGARLPEYATDGAAAFDLFTVDGGLLEPHSSLVLGTGLAVEVPAGWALLAFSRSGHGFKVSVRLANCVGVIDSDYRGEVMVKLASDDPGALPIQFRPGDRVAQGMLVPAPRVAFEVVDSLPETARGTGGLGSTGR